MDTPKDIRFTIRMNPELHEWFKRFAQHANTNMSQLVIEYVESLRKPKSAPSAEQYEQQYEQRYEHTNLEFQQLTGLLAEKDHEIQRLHKQFERRDEQLDSALRSLSHSQQLLAIQTQNNAALTDCLQTIEDTRQRSSWWKRLFRHH